MSFRFERPVDATQFEQLPGVRVTAQARDRLELAVTGSIAPVLRAAVDFDPTDVTARPADLDELFLRYYRPTHDEEALDVR